MPTSALAERAVASIGTNQSSVLTLIHNGQPIETKHHIPRAEAQSPPTFSYTGAKPTATYLVICLDLDAPFKSLPLLSPILHLAHSGFKSSGVDGALTSSEPAIAPYAPPGPPPGAAPHRYVFFLFEQPPAFDVKKCGLGDGKPLGLRARVRFNLEAFLTKAGLGEPLAANYFVSN